MSSLFLRPCQISNELMVVMKNSASSFSRSCLVFGSPWRRFIMMSESRHIFLTIVATLCLVILFFLFRYRLYRKMRGFFLYCFDYEGVYE